MKWSSRPPTRSSGWDGTHNGKPEINGVYVYTVVATSVEGQDFDRSGKVTLIR
ncbi:MAG: hypothetical protein IPI05_06575 [Flavobacteriales bacterium]|nr:hypothetical protein [Flavobacteriales bacterium]